MKTIIKSILLENFKGCKKAKYDLGEVTRIFGSNGAGKTTIATAFYWVFADRDYDLHSNPPIRPLGVEECTPRVEIALEIDGRTVMVAKFQKCTVKKSKTGGADNISLSNCYEVNSVEYGERDFKAKMGEYDFDFERFLALSHPDVFTGQKPLDMRKVLFSLASEKSDKEIADMTTGAKDVSVLLANYTMDEVKAMQNATLRKIREDYGKEGEILRAKIEGLETAKVDVDVSELELHKSVLAEQIAVNKEKQRDISKQFEEYQKLSDGIMELKFAEGDLQRKANAEINSKRRDVLEHIANKENLVKLTEATIRDTEREIADIKASIECDTVLIENMRKRYRTAQKLEFDESNMICSFCGQEYPAEKKAQLRDEFEQKKQLELSGVTRTGNGAKEAIERNSNLLKEKQDELEEHHKSLELLNSSIAELKIELDALPTSIDVSDTEEYRVLHSQIAEKEQSLQHCNSADDIRRNLENENRELQSQLTEIEKQIAVAGRNIKIDEQIAELRNKQRSYEQQKADCEKILEQLILVGKKKNELLTDDINSHFDIVRWQMFEYQKNGEYKECCVPLIDGKRFGESTNTGREVLAKLDIINGMQKFYDQLYPVFIDGAECISEATKKRIDMKCQIIYLSVSEDNELKCEV